MKIKEIWKSESREREKCRELINAMNKAKKFKIEECREWMKEKKKA